MLVLDKLCAQGLWEMFLWEDLDTDTNRELIATDSINHFTFFLQPPMSFFFFFTCNLKDGQEASSIIKQEKKAHDLLSLG